MPNVPNTVLGFLLKKPRAYPNVRMFYPTSVIAETFVQDVGWPAQDGEDPHSNRHGLGAQAGDGRG